MKFKSNLLLFIMMGLFGISLVAQANGAATQWFPEVDTTIDYNLSSIITLPDDTRAESNTFYIYNTTAGPILDYMLVPTYVIENFVATSSWIVSPLLFNHTEVIYSIEYSQKSSTELWRSVSVRAGDLIINDGYVYLLSFGYSGGYSMMESISVGSQLSYVLKTNFYSYINAGFVDHLDCSLGPGAEVLQDTYLVSVSTTEYTALDINMVSTYNKTYIYDSTGRVIRYTTTDYSALMLNIGYKRASYLFTADIGSGTSGGIPGFSFFVGFLGFFTAVLLISWARKRAIQ